MKDNKIDMKEPQTGTQPDSFLPIESGKFDLLPSAEYSGKVAVGNILQDENSLPWETDNSGNNQLPAAGVMTTLPREFFSVDESGTMFMAAESLDILSVGNYSLSETGNTATITVTEVDGKKYITSASSRNSRELFPEYPLKTIKKRQLPPSFGGFSFTEALAVQLSGTDKEGKGGVKLLKKLMGFSFDFNAGQRTIPTPKTIEYFAKKNNMPIALIRESNPTGTIPLEEYLGVFAKGEYPVGIGDLAVYAHDVRSNDHIVGVTVLGREGLALLAPLAKSVLNSTASEESKLDVANYFDRATVIISRIIDQPSDASYIDVMKSVQNNNASVVADVIRFCTEARELSDSLEAGVDADALFEFLKSRLFTLHKEFNFGVEFDDLLVQLSATTLPGRQLYTKSNSDDEFIL